MVAADMSVGRQVTPVNEKIKRHLIQTEDPVCFDETDVRLGGKLNGCISETVQLK